MNTRETVAEFHRAFELYCPERFHLDEHELMMRAHLIGEELSELALSVWSGNRVEMLDALCDLEYVIQGTAVSMGIHTGGYRSSSFPLDSWKKILAGVSCRLSQLLSFSTPVSLSTTLVQLSGYVSTGVWMMGLSHSTFLKAFGEVHRSNMSKLGPDGKPFLINGRISKGPGYNPPKLESIINEQMDPTLNAASSRKRSCRCSED